MNLINAICLEGRLANSLLIYRHAVLTYKADLVFNPCLKRYGKYFSFENTLCDKETVTTNKGLFKNVEWMNEKVRQKDFQHVDQNEKKHRDKFRLKEKYEKIVDSIFKKINKKNTTNIGIHFRGTDYKTFHGGIHYHEYEVYKQELEQEVKRLNIKKHNTILFTDEPELKDDNAVHASKYTKFDPVLDLYLMSKMDYVITTSTTYTRWAAYVGDVIKVPIGKNQRMKERLKK